MERDNWTDEWGVDAIQTIDHALNFLTSNNIRFSTMKNPSRPGMMFCDLHWGDHESDRWISGGGHGILQRDAIIDGANAMKEAFDLDPDYVADRLPTPPASSSDEGSD